MKESRKEEIEKAFAKADKDGTGTLSVKELQSALVELNDEKMEEDLEQIQKNIGFVEVLMSAVDKNGDKTVTCEEFIELITEELDQEKMLRNMVRDADKDGDGLLLLVRL
eukprot:TRINITY_DN749_c0_g1_i6.p1 TRINITY_DN749_c0_g1~~TRINITY_DN749_c0_g1_i6.p1  ORF type:complete len:126 (-),score=44.52 TRINITY_DN749_c0_g1_i6:349-678(-)